MAFFELSVMEGGMRAPHHKYVVVIASVIMRFGTGVKLDVFYAMVAKYSLMPLLLHHYEAITCILSDTLA